MRTRAQASWCVTLCCMLAACSSGSNADNGSDAGGPDSGSGSTGVTAAQLSALQRLRYDDGPAPADPSNRVADDAAARRLGQQLFFDTSLSGPLIEADNDGSPATLGTQGQAGRVSCAGCHLPGSGFVDTRSPHHQISLAANWTRRRTPSLLEVAFAPLYNWDGRRDSIWSQALGVMESQNEFNSGRLFVAQQIFARYHADYEAIFGKLPALDDEKRFPALSAEAAGCQEKLTRQGSTFVCRGKPGDGADYDALPTADQDAVTRVAVNATKAIAAYVRLLRCGPSRFDDWLDGDKSALGASEQRGAALFVGRGKCSDCHSGPRLSDEKFHNIGLSPASVAVAFVDDDDEGAAAAVPELLADPMNTKGTYSDGDRGVLPTAADPKQLGAFRTPGLRCIASHPSFMHTAQLATLEQVIAFHDRGGDGAGNYPGTSELTALELSDDEQADLVAFLKALDGPGPDAALMSAPTK